jgi:hydroxymethylbilane synthase
MGLVPSLDLRGNVDTRIRKLREGQCDAIVLALAGLERLGRADEVSQVLDPADMLPAPGQGVIAVESDSSDRGLVVVQRQVVDHIN